MSINKYETCTETKGFDIKMKTEIINEQPLYSYYGCCSGYDWGWEQKIELFHKDLEKAEIGEKWVCEDQDRYPNSTNTWTVTAEVVYRNGNNVYLHCYDSIGHYDKLLAIELR